MTEGDGDSVDASGRTVPSSAVINAVADAEGVSPEEIRPPAYETLHAAIDPEALDSLFAPRSDGSPRPGGEVSFSFCGYEVTVERNGTVTLEDPSE